MRWRQLFNSSNICSQLTEKGNWKYVTKCSNKTFCRVTILLNLHWLSYSYVKHVCYGPEIFKAWTPAAFSKIINLSRRGCVFHPCVFVLFGLRKRNIKCVPFYCIIVSYLWLLYMVFFTGNLPIRIVIIFCIWCRVCTLTDLSCF